MRKTISACLLAGLLCSAAYFICATHNVSEAHALTPASPAIVICSQNLQNFGAKDHRPTSFGGDSKRSKRKRSSAGQKNHLVERFIEGRCDIIATQEVGGDSEKEALTQLNRLAKELSERTGGVYQTYVGESRDSRIRNGFIVREGAGSIENVKSFARLNLPKLQPLGPNRHFARGPLELVLVATDPVTNRKKRFLIVTDHLKSKVDGYKDPTQTQFESSRMEMSQALRDIVQSELKRFGPGTVGVILGDFNSQRDSASAEILEGRLELKDFFPPRPCRVTESLHPDCGRSPTRAPAFIGLFEEQARITNKTLGSYRYKNQLELIDEILISSPDLTLAQEGRQLRVQIIGTFGKGSDHKLLAAELRW